MRPLGVVSKKVMGDRKMANAILSCNLREACVATADSRLASGRSGCPGGTAYLTGRVTHLDGAEYPQKQGLHHHKCGTAHPECKVDAQEEADIRVAIRFVVGLTSINNLKRRKRAIQELLPLTSSSARWNPLLARISLPRPHACEWGRASPCGCAR